MIKNTYGIHDQENSKPGHLNEGNWLPVKTLSSTLL